jgi:hypothetical protein
VSSFVSPPYSSSSLDAHERFYKHFKRDWFAFLVECHPVQFWMLSRHGTRYAKGDVINDMWSLHSLRDEIISNLEKGRKYYLKSFYQEQI